MILTPDELTRSPAWLPLDQQGAAVRMVKLDEAAYRAASFLDQRLLSGSYAQEVCAAALLEAAGGRLRPRAHYIFHTGHVGSTLISRLIGAHEGFFSLREPALLRVLAGPAAAAAAPGLPATLALLGRTWRPAQRAVVKVTSFVSELAGSILAESEPSSALFMFARPLAYLQCIFAGANSRLESRHLGPARLQRLQRRLGADWPGPDPGSEGEGIAMSWLCEMTALRRGRGALCIAGIVGGLRRISARPRGRFADRLPAARRTPGRAGARGTRERSADAAVFQGARTRLRCRAAARAP